MLYEKVKELKNKNPEKTFPIASPILEIISPNQSKIIITSNKKDG